MSLTINKAKPTGVWWKDHSLSIVLIALLLIQTIISIFAGHIDWMATNQDHDVMVTGWPGDFWIWWTYEYSTSIVADTYGAFILVMLSKWFIERGSSETADKDPSNDSVAS